MDEKRLLVVEDDELLCKILEQNLQNEGYVVETLFHGEGIPGVVSRKRFNLVVLDLLLPGKPGSYWLTWFKRYYPGVPIIIISAKTKPKQRVEGLKAGAKDYLVKPFDTEELLIKVRMILNSSTHNDHQTLLEMGELMLDTSQQKVIRKGEEVELTKLECDILQLFFMNPGVPLSREELMSQVMGVEYVPTNRSIDTHINRLRKKIEDMPSRPTYIHTIRNRGYCFQLPG